MARGAEGTATLHGLSTISPPTGRGLLGWFPVLTLAVLLAPLLAGLFGTLLPAFGYLPALGGESLSLAPWRALFATPGVVGGVGLSLGVGLASTLLSLGLVLMFCAAWHGTPWFTRLTRLLSPLLAIPHVTVAFGLAFLLAPSGWLLRVLVPITGFQRPPDWLIVNDPWGLSLILGLVIKETPFLLLMVLASLNQIDALALRRVATSLGYGPTVGWLKAVLPQVYPQLRLPLFAVLAYSCAAVEMALVLGPTTPAPLAVQVLRWFNEPDLSLRFMASAGALLQLLVVVLAMLIWCALEGLVRRLGRIWSRRGARGRGDGGVRWALLLCLCACCALALLGLAAMALWSVAGLWRYPQVLPATLDIGYWIRYGDDIARPLWNTLSVGLGAALIALCLVVGCLEHETRSGRRLGALWLLYLPLLIPQIAFLFGAQVLLVSAGVDGHWIALLWSHLLFVLPYVFLSLADPYRAFDGRFTRIARCLGVGVDGVFWRVRLPMLLRPLLVALAVGFAVSVAQYLPTLFAGGGRFATLTTEAVALSAGSNRRVMGVYAVLQMSLPFAIFALAQGLPAVVFRHRQGLRVER